LGAIPNDGVRKDPEVYDEHCGALSPIRSHRMFLYELMVVRAFIDAV
jgi:hypothetical protein